MALLLTWLILEALGVYLNIGVKIVLSFLCLLVECNPRFPGDLSDEDLLLLFQALLRCSEYVMKFQECSAHTLYLRDSFERMIFFCSG